MGVQPKENALFPDDISITLNMKALTSRVT
jgi:hypothetical protein